MTPAVESSELRATQVRPLRRIRDGEWRSRDGLFTFVNGAKAGAEGSNGQCWHVWIHGMLDAWGDRYLTLGEAVDEVRAEYGLAR